MRVFGEDLPNTYARYPFQMWRAPRQVYILPRITVATGTHRLPDIRTRAAAFFCIGLTGGILKGVFCQAANGSFALALPFAGVAGSWP